MYARFDEGERSQPGLLGGQAWPAIRGRIAVELASQGGGDESGRKRDTKLINSVLTHQICTRISCTCNYSHLYYRAEFSLSPSLTPCRILVGTKATHGGSSFPRAVTGYCSTWVGYILMCVSVSRSVHGAVSDTQRFGNSARLSMNHSAGRLRVLYRMYLDANRPVPQKSTRADDAVPPPTGLLASLDQGIR